MTSKKTDIIRNLKSIKQAINDFSEGIITGDSISVIYSDLKKSFDELEKKYGATGDAGLIKGVLYEHNARNFSAVTSVWTRKDGTLDLAESVGNEELMPAIRKKILQADAGNIIKTDDSSYRLYSYSFESAPNEKTILTSVSKSEYFDSNFFEITAAFLKEIYGIINSRKCFSMNFYDDFSVEILDFVKSIPLNSGIDANLIIFNNLEDIFSHTGAASIIEFAETLLSSLKESYPPGSKIIHLSLSLYIILISGVSENFHVSPDLEFSYKGLPVPFKIQAFRIDSGDSLQEFMEFINQCYFRD